MDKIVNIKLEHIHPHPDNPRKNLGDLTELSDSIKKRGILQNLTVVPQEGNPGEYTVIIGHRRRAAAILARIEEVPCRISEGLSKKEQFSTMMEENMQRNDLTIYEQAQGFQMMLDLGDTEEQIAEKTGFSKTTIRHRLNIAKLDQKKLQEKEKDDSFQLSLKDLYELEKIKDVKARNKILDEASGSANIKWMVNREVEKIDWAEKTKKITDVLEAMGFKKAPDNVSAWTNGWKEIKQLDLDKEPPKRIRIKDKEQVYYLGTSYAVLLMQKEKKGEKTPEQIKQDQITKNKKAIAAKIKEIRKACREFILGIISGKITRVKNEEEVRERIWKLMIKGGGYVEIADMTKFFTKKDYWQIKEEEREDAKKKVENLSYTQAMLVVMYRIIEKMRDIFDYNGKYLKNIGAKYMEIMEILEPYGWSLPDEEMAEILNGTHDLYTKEERK